VTRAAALTLIKLAVAALLLLLAAVSACWIWHEMWEHP
jgi:hypothetical protein